VAHFLNKFCMATSRPVPQLGQEAIEVLMRHDWPGNVRELENAIERACALCEEDMILATDLPPQIVAAAQGGKAEQAIAAMPVGQTLDEFIQQQERGYIDATLTHCGGSREKAASMLGISMATLYRKVEPKSKK
jgi:DNA-binding NtrC family response regulator